ncbi:hypothetical protein N7466_006782 [Penicillium verhagenii]|uniref:uncharacterized protein n=1 Tax=Penicillium verhagenii TaxID=1562060 RepID=UPI0025456E5C|nr:uncharacterized protein N7466_006782 [Penicillium verhagenii]KAJ5927826.1 hypothetical protein N7466_006782 [Penicillium verhagenii]
MHSLFKLLQAALITSWMTVATANSGVFEVDLIYPRNETYTPSPLMPMVFAVQNPDMADPLGASISWSFLEGGNRSAPGSLLDGLLELSPMNVLNVSGDLDKLTLDIPGYPLLVTRYLDTFSFPDGTWNFEWSLEVYNCTSGFEDYQNALQVTNYVTFNTSKSGKAPDLVAATSAGTCDTAEGFAFNAISLEYNCGVLEPTQTTNPCAVTIDSAAESNLMAMATEHACSILERPIHPNVTCPSATPSSNTAGQSRTAAAPVLFMVLATLTTMAYFG